MSIHFHYRTHHFRAHNDRMKYLSVFMLGKPVTCFFIILRDYNRNIGIITAPPPGKKNKKLYCYSFNIFQTNRREWLVIRKITLNWKVRQRFLNIFKLIPYMFGEIITSPPPPAPQQNSYSLNTSKWLTKSLLYITDKPCLIKLINDGMLYQISC